MKILFRATSTGGNGSDSITCDLQKTSFRLQSMIDDEGGIG